MACLAALWIFATVGAAQDIQVRSTPAFRHDMQLLTDAVKAEDGKKLAEVLQSIQPTTCTDHVELATAGLRNILMVSAAFGPEEGLRMLDMLEKKIKLPTPKELGAASLAAESIPSLSPEEVKAFDLRNTKGMSQEAKRARYEENAADRIRGIPSFFVDQRVILLEDSGQHARVLDLIENYLQSPDLNEGSKEKIRRLLARYKLEGSPAQPLVAERTLGTFAGLESLRGKVVLLDYTAHWCGPCKASIPTMAAVYDKFHASGFEIVGVTRFWGFFSYNANNKVTPEQELIKLDGLWKELGVRWPTVVGPKANFDAYYVDGIPQMFLVDRKGIIRHLWGGFRAGSGHEKTLSDAVEKLLKE